MVRVALSVPVTFAGLMLAVTLFGADTVNLTMPLKPFDAVIVTVEFVVWFVLIVIAKGTPIVKSPLLGELDISKT